MASSQVCLIEDMLGHLRSTTGIPMVVSQVMIDDGKLYCKNKIIVIVK